MCRVFTIVHIHINHFVIQVVTYKSIIAPNFSFAGQRSIARPYKNPQFVLFVTPIHSFNPVCKMQSL